VVEPANTKGEGERKKNRKKIKKIRGKAKSTFEKKQLEAEKISNPHNTQRGNGNPQKTHLWLAKYLDVILTKDGARRIVTSVQFSRTSNVWQVKTKLAKQSEYDDREYNVVAASGECLLDIKRGKKNTVSACIKEFNRSIGI
jgi:hypothetical protein